MITQASIRLQLAKDEAKEASETLTPPIHMDISPSILIGTGIDLEEQQQVIQFHAVFILILHRRRLHIETDNLGPHATDQQKAKLQLRINVLTRRIDAWITVQTLYIPGVASLRAQATLQNDTIQKPQDICLWMPSTLSRRVPCDTKLEETEWKLRTGQAHDALNELRQGLRSRSYMLRFKDRFLRGQGANTRARNSLKAVDAKISASAAKYRAAHSALLALSSLLRKVGWKNTLRPLEAHDIRPMTDGTDDLPSEGRRRLSWIWLVCGYGEGDTENDGDEGLQNGKLVHLAFTLKSNYWIS